MVLLIHAALVNAHTPSNVMFGFIFSTKEKSMVSLLHKIHLHHYGQEFFASTYYLQVYFNSYRDGKELRQ